MGVVQVAVEGPAQSSALRLDALTQQLKTDLCPARPSGKRRHRRPRSRRAPSIHEIGTLVVSVVCSAATINSICNVVVAYIQRTAAQSVTWRRHDLEVTLTGLPSKEQRALLERILRDGEPDPEGGKARASVGG